MIWMLLERISGLHDSNIGYHAQLSPIFAIPAILVYVFALLDKRKNYYDNKMTWKQGFISGIFISIFVTILSPLGQLLTHYVISPDYLENAANYAVEVGKMTEIDAKNYFNFSSYLLQSIIGALMMGALTSAIVAIFVKRK